MIDRLSDLFKQDLGLPCGTLVIRVRKSGVHLKWKPDALSASRATRGRNRADLAERWMRERFAEQREWNSADLFAAARAAGISRSAIFEARERIEGLKSRRITKDGSASWAWCVQPAAASEGAILPQCVNGN